MIGASSRHSRANRIAPSPVLFQLYGNNADCSLPLGTVSGIPSTGFRLKCRLYDEDASDHDDRLGNVTVRVAQIGTEWGGIKERGYDIKKRMGSKRAYMFRGCAALLNSNIHMSGRLYLSMEVLGESEPPYGRMYTIGVTSWTKHFSPMIGRIAGTKAPGSSSNGEKKPEKYE